MSKCLYKLVTKCELHMVPSGKRKARVFEGYEHVSGYRYGDIDEVFTELTCEDFSTAYFDAVNFPGLSRKVDPAALIAVDPESESTADTFEKVIAKSTIEVIEDTDAVLAISLIRELPKNELFQYIKDKLGEINEA